MLLRLFGQGNSVGSYFVVTVESCEDNAETVIDQISDVSVNWHCVRSGFR